MHRLIPLIVLGLVLSACSDATEDPDAVPTPSEESVAPAESSEPAAPEEPPRPSPTERPHPVSIPALMEQEYDGRALRLGRVVYETATQTQYEVTYRGDGLTISGRLAVPKGNGPFPAIVLAHGYIDPDDYVNGQGMTREREWFAGQGYVALHVDYRNHAASSDTRLGELDLRMGYTEDVINAVHALRRWGGPVDDERVAVGGRSMGGGVVYNVLTAQPGLVDAGVVWAPVSSDAVDNYERWIAPDPAREGIADEIVRRYGAPRSNPRFWAGISARTYFDEITEPVLIHHGTSDDTCPIRWSHATARRMDRAGVDVTFEIYEGEEHAFGPQFFASMERTGRFLDRHLR